MDPKRPFPLATLLLAGFAGVWLLVQAVPAVAVLLVVGLLVALAAFVVLALWQRQLAGADRTLAQVGAFGGLAWFAAVLVFALLANPITTKGDPDERIGINEEPPAWIDSTFKVLSGLLPLMVVAASVVALWPAWGVRERALGAGGAGLLAIVIVPPFFGTGPDAMVGLVLFGAGLLAWLAALLLPLLHPAGTRGDRVEAHGAE